VQKVLFAAPTLADLDGTFWALLREADLQPLYPRERRPLTEAKLLAELPGCSACLAGFEPYTRQVLEACPET
jgi:D-3-phosphoglycerate dehydrogenase